MPNHPYIKKVMEIYETYCSTDITEYPDNPDVITNKFNKKELNKLKKEFIKINELIENDIPSLSSILSLEIDDYIKKEIVEKFILFIQTDKNSYEFFEIRDSINKDINKYNVSNNVKQDEEEILGILKMPSKKRKINSESSILRDKIKSLDTSEGNKDIIMKKLDKFEDMSKTDSEYHKLKEYMDKVSNIPFNKYADTNVTHESLKEAKNLLDKHVMFNYEAKDEIMNFLINNSNHCISLYGLPGTSKSTLIQKGLSEALKRPMRVISLGGKKDAAYLTGHSYTYEGAVCGRIIDILIETKVMNPIIYFDELDKITGKAINGVLTHLIDPSQNFDFHDNYFSGLSFDLSRVLFVFSYNDKSELDLVVSDRIKHIEVKTLDTKQKTEVLKTIIVPKSLKQYFGSDNVNIIFEDECLNYLARQYEGEGMRGLIKDIDHIISRIKILYFLRNSNDKEIVKLKYNTLKLDFDNNIIINSDIIKKYFELNDKQKTYNSMYL